MRAPFFPRLPAMLFATALAGITLAFAPSIHAKDQAEPAKEISEKVSAELGKLRTLLDAKNYAEALRLINGLLGGVANPSYDLAILTQIKAQVFLYTSNYAAAVAPLETTIQLGERHAFFDRRTQLENLYTLAQIYYQLASSSTQPAEQRRLFEKAHDTISRWLAQSPAPTADAQLYAASILFGQAMVDPAHPDLARIREAQLAAEKSLYLELQPKPAAYVLILAALQQRGDLVPMADLLELLVNRQPESVNYWQQLAAVYYALAAESKDEAEVQRHNLRALLTLERAQARGLLKSPKENHAVVSLYFALQQYDRAIALLEAGLHSGAIENTQPNWELLASAYQQANNPDAALTTLQKAIERFPRAAGLEFSLGQLHYTLGRSAEAYDHLARSVTKERLERPGQAHLFLAYVAFELQRYDDASRWLEAGAAFPDAKAEDISRLRRAVTEKLRERAASARPAL